MNMNTELTYKLLKYLGQGIVIYFLFKYIPKEPISDRDLLLITLIVILSYAVFENIYTLYNNDNQELISSVQCNTQCDKQCTVKENFDNFATEHMSGSTKKQPLKPTPINKHNNLSTQQINTPVSETAPAIIHNENTNQSTQQVQQETTVKVLSKGYIQVEEMEKQRSNEEKEFNVSKMATTGREALPEITQPGIKRNKDGSFTITVPSVQSAAITTQQLDDEMKPAVPYNYTDYNTLPVPTTWDTWENGSSFLPPAQWFPVPPHPPLCITDKACPVCPAFTNGATVNFQEFSQSKKPYTLN